MTALSLTEHAVVRLSQRGLGADDIDLIMLLGSEAPDGYLVRDHDCAALEATLKRLLDKVQRLKGKRVVVKGEHLVTAYHATAKEQRRLRRRAFERGMTQ